jgi:hypothetical protein
MKSDSGETLRQKEHLREQAIVAYGVTLPPWFVEGTLVGDFRRLLTMLRLAHERYSTEAVPTRRAGTRLSCPICGGGDFVYVGASDWLLCADNTCGGEIRIGSIPKEN